MTNKPLLTAITFAIAGALAVSCQDIADDDHYAAPSWLKGNAYEVMQGDGNYTSFLKAIDLTGYKPIVNGQSILTVMASDDQAWADYLSQQGFDNVEEMWKQNPVELKKTVGFQLMYTPTTGRNSSTSDPTKATEQQPRQKNRAQEHGTNTAPEARTIWSK